MFVDLLNWTHAYINKIDIGIDRPRPKYISAAEKVDTSLIQLKKKRSYKEKTIFLSLTTNCTL